MVGPDVPGVQWDNPAAAAKSSPTEIINNKLVMRDMTGAKEAKKIYENLINPAVEKQKVKPESGGDDSETGYKTSERAALENQLLQIENVANAIQEKDNE